MRAWLMAGALLIAAAPASAQIAVPPVARVSDQTGTLSSAQQQTLAARLATLEQAKGSQIAVLVLPSTEPETIEQYAIRVAEAWKLGRKGIDDGALLVVAMRDRAVRIEVGYGLEGAIPDAIAKRVIEEIILPRFRAGDLPGGIEAGVEQLIALVDGEPLPEPAATGHDLGDAGSALPVLFVIAMALGQGLRRALGPAPAGLMVGGLAFVLVWWLVGVALFAALVGIALFFLTLVGVRGGVHSAGGSRGGGWSAGGGFSGGGGGFGGGGASGRW
jgi:uncharacterized protein